MSNWRESIPAEDWKLLAMSRNVGNATHTAARLDCRSKILIKQLSASERTAGGGSTNPSVETAMQPLHATDPKASNPSKHRSSRVWLPETGLTPGCRRRALSVRKKDLTTRSSVDPDGFRVVLVPDSWVAG
jgi:hypothetical protein